jgi:hypothetical protein
MLSEEFIKVTCQPFTENTCRYLGADANGWCCTKLNPSIAPYIDRRVAAGTMRATGDNCPGVPDDG